MKEQVENHFTGGDEFLDRDPCWELARRIARSPALSRATQLRNILLYMVRQAILRPNQPVDDFEIAHSVLGRRGDFNPLDDSIVRVQMAHLRKRLNQYFAIEGKDEEIVVSIALGSYEPVFSKRSKPVLAALPADADVHATDEAVPAENAKLSPLPIELATAPVEGSPRRRNASPWWLAGCLVMLILGAVAGFHFRPSPSGGAGAGETSNPILRQIFAPGGTVYVVLADTTLVTLQNTIHSDISIDQYLDPSYPDNVLARMPDPVVRSELKSLTTSRYTSLNDADVAGQCSYWGVVLGARTYVRFARYLHVRDFQQGNFVIVGSRRGNPWVSLFEPNLNFYFEEDPTTHTFHFRNRNPKPGELRTYNLTAGKAGDSVGYVDIAILPNLGNTGSVLLLNGFSIETNEAAADLIFNKNLSPTITRALGRLTPTSKAEIFLRVRNLDKAELGWEIVSIRTEPS